MNRSNLRAAGQVLGRTPVPSPPGRRRSRLFRAAFLPVLLLSATACGDDGPGAPELQGDIATIVGTFSGLSFLEDGLAAADLVSALQGAGPFTVFAPVNPAFYALGDDVIANLLDPDNVDLLTRVLQFHVVPGVAAMSASLTDGQTVTTLQGEDLTIGVSGSTITVNGATIVGPDIQASNGVIHFVDVVLVPEVDIIERVILTDATQTLLAAVEAAGLTATLKGSGPFTVLAPVNSAIAALDSLQLDALMDTANVALLQKVLTYHVIPGDIREAQLTNGLTATTVEGSDVMFELAGDTARVNGFDIVATDIVVQNGVIHLIDGVLTENLDLVDVAVLNGFPTLVSLVKTAGLEATLRGDNGGNGFTLFAPTEEAFAALTSVPTGQALVDLLSYHVVSGTVLSEDLSDGLVVTTLEGSTFTVSITGTAVSITDQNANTVNVTLTDVPASNGVIHVIDGVITP